MNLRLPIVTGIVVLAGVAAAVRGARPHPSAAAMTTARNAFEATGAATADRTHTRVAPPTAKVVVYVAGDVARAGVYTLAPGARAVDALRSAGGALPDADLVAVNLAAPLADGEEIAVPVKGAPPVRAAGRRRRASASTASADLPAHRRAKRRRRKTPRDSSLVGGPAAQGPPQELVDVNTADESELETLPGIGPGLAGRILLVRDQSGPFSSLDDLLDVAGMTQSKLDELEPYVTLR